MGNLLLHSAFHLTQGWAIWPKIYIAIQYEACAIYIAIYIFYIGGRVVKFLFLFFSSTFYLITIQPPLGARTLVLFTLIDLYQGKQDLKLTLMPCALCTQQQGADHSSQDISSVLAAMVTDRSPRITLLGLRSQLPLPPMMGGGPTVPPMSEQKRSLHVPAIYHTGPL